MTLEIRNLSKTYGNGVRALDDVSLTLAPGMFGLLGPNGAGKSTLMNTLATLQEPDAGVIRLGEIDALKEPQRVRADLGYLPQEFGSYPNTSAEAMLDHLALLKGIVDKGERRDHVGRLLDLVNLTEAKKRSVDTYSGGMRQRYGIAQALLGDPSLVIVDEPTAGLDPAERNRFHKVLAEIGENTIVLLSTHIVEDVANLCERMAILANGRIVAQGTPRELTDALRGTLWQKSVARGEPYTGSVVSSRLLAGRLLVVVRADAPPDVGFLPKEPDLEDVYFAHVPQSGA